MVMSGFEALARSSLPASSDIDAKLEKAANEKDQGNSCFKSGDTKGALYHYHLALLCVKGLHGENDTQKKQREDIHTTVNNNMAAVYIKEAKFEKAINCCTEVLNRDPNNTKALYRRGKAYLETNSLDKSESDLKKALELDPKDAAIRKELNTIKLRNKQAETGAKQFYSTMFEKMYDKKEEGAPSVDSSSLSANHAAPTLPASKKEGKLNNNYDLTEDPLYEQLEGL